MALTPRLRKLALTTHVTASVGWLGAVIAFLALSVAGLTSQDPQTVQGTYLVMELTGWAVEARVYAADPTRNFLPSTGRLTTYRPQQESQANGITVRNDTGVDEGG